MIFILEAKQEPKDIILSLELIIKSEFLSNNRLPFVFSNCGKMIFLKVYRMDNLLFVCLIP